MTKKAAEAAGALVRWLRRNFDDLDPPGSPALALPGGGSVSSRDLEHPRQRGDGTIAEARRSDRGGGGQESRRGRNKNKAGRSRKGPPKTGDTEIDQLIEDWWKNPHPRTLREEFKAQGFKIDDDVGRVFDGLRGNWRGALKQLLSAKDGEVPGALFHPKLGEIDVIWGRSGSDPRSPGDGLEKIIERHSEVLLKRDEILEKAEPITPNKRNIFELDKITLKHKKVRIVVRTDRNGRPKLWLLTAFDKTAS